MYKHEKNDHYMYYAEDSWWVGPEVGVQEGSIHAKSVGLTPEHVTETWQERHDGEWEESGDMSVQWEGECAICSIVGTVYLH